MPPESGSLEDSFDQFVQQNQMENSRSALNKFLVTRDISPVRSSLKTPWNDTSERTRRYYIHNALVKVSHVPRLFSVLVSQSFTLSVGEVIEVIITL